MLRLSFFRLPFTELHRTLFPVQPPPHPRAPRPRPREESKRGAAKRAEKRKRRVAAVGGFRLVREMITMAGRCAIGVLLVLAALAATVRAAPLTMSSVQVDGSGTPTVAPLLDQVRGCSTHGDRKACLARAHTREIQSDGLHFGSKRRQQTWRAGSRHEHRAGPQRACSQLAFGCCSRAAAAREQKEPAGATCSSYCAKGQGTTEWDGMDHRARHCTQAMAILEARTKPAAFLTYRSTSTADGQSDFVTDDAAINTMFAVGDVGLRASDFARTQAQGNPAVTVPVAVSSVSIFASFPGLLPVSFCGRQDHAAAPHALSTCTCPHETPCATAPCAPIRAAGSAAPPAVHARQDLLRQHRDGTPLRAPQGRLCVAPAACLVRHPSPPSPPVLAPPRRSGTTPPSWRMWPPRWPTPRT